VRYEPVKFDKFDKHGHQDQSRSLSPITDVTTPASSRSRSNGTPEFSERIAVPLANTTLDEGDVRDKSNDSVPTIPTTESSPSSSEEPPLLNNSCDHSPYKNLFFRPSPSNSPDPAGSNLSHNAVEAPPVGSGEQSKAISGPQTLSVAPGRSLDIPESVGSAESEDSISVLDSEDDLDFTLRQVQQRISITTISPGTPRPLSTHITPEGPHQPLGRPSNELEIEDAPLSSFLTPPPESSARDSSYSATSETSFGRITSSFPVPPSLPGTATPSTLLEAYFTATDNTPAQSRESVLDA